MPLSTQINAIVRFHLRCNPVPYTVVLLIVITLSVERSLSNSGNFMSVSGMVFSAVFLSAVFLMLSRSLTRVRFIASVPVNRSSIHRAHFTLLYGCAFISGLSFVISALLGPFIFGTDSVMLNWEPFSLALLSFYMLLFMCMLVELLYTLFPVWLVIIALASIFVSPVLIAYYGMIQRDFEDPLADLVSLFFPYELFLWPTLLVGIVATQVLSEWRFVRKEIG